MTDARQRLGIRGETLACRELERRGYVVLSRRYRTRFGEIDIVCTHGDWLVFVEVKTREDCEFFDPSDAVTWQKQRRVISMATEYLERRGLEESPCRFDVIAIDTGVHPPAVTVFEDAFRADD